MKLPPDQLAHALALSAAHGNTLAEVRSGQLSNAKATANGFVAMQATLCALLAGEGVTGPLTVLEGRRGLNRGLLAGGDLNLLAEPIRERFRISDVGIKPYPCIGTAQTMIAGVLQLRAGITDPMKAVKHIEVRMADVPMVSGQVADVDRRFPTSRETADHSLPYMIAAIMVDDFNAASTGVRHEHTAGPCIKRPVVKRTALRARDFYCSDFLERHGQLAGLVWRCNRHQV
jgi:2-methylcitrate dehydratase